MAIVAGYSTLDMNNDFVTGSRAEIHITSRGSEFYWGLTTVFTLASLFLLVWTQLVSFDRRFFHKSIALACLIMSITYFSMASNLGWIGIPVERRRFRAQVSGDTRQIFWVRYIGWTISFPLIISNIYFIAGLSWPSFGSACIFTWIFVIGRLLGALVSTTYKWGYYVFCLFGYFYLSFDLLVPTRGRALKTLENSMNAFTLPVLIQVGVLWILYPIAWGVCEGGNFIAPDSEAVFYGVIDLFVFLFVPVFSLFSLKKVDVSDLAGREKRKRRDERNGALE